MSKIPTVEEIIKNMPDYWQGGKAQYAEEDVKSAIIEFAKLHVEAALKAALEDIPCLGSSTDIASYEEIKEAVLTAYPLENIK